MEGRLLWKENEVRRSRFEAAEAATTPLTAKRVPRSPEARHKRRICVLLSVNVTDLDSQTGYGDSDHPIPASPQYFVEKTAIPRLVHLLEKHGIANKTTWFVPGDYLVSKYKDILKPVIRSGAEFALMAYENQAGLFQLENRETQESLLFGAFLNDIKEALGGRSPIGFRARTEVTAKSAAKIAELLDDWGFRYGMNTTSIS